MYVTRKVDIQKPRNIEPASPVNNLLFIEKLYFKKTMHDPTRIIEMDESV